MSLQTRTLLIVTSVLVVAVFATAATLTWSARRSLLSQKRSDGLLIAELLARSAKSADEAATSAEHAIGEQMLTEATIAAHLVALAEGVGLHPEEISARLRDITDRTVLDEILITDEKGRVFLRNVSDFDFTFSRDSRLQPQAHAFWGLLTGERPGIVQETRKREIDDEFFKYAGVSGVDKPRIVQVGIRADFIERLREDVGLTGLITAVVASGKVLAVHVLDTNLVTLAYGAAPDQAVSRELSQADVSSLTRAVTERRMLSTLDGPVLKVMAPITGARDRLVGAMLVAFPTPDVAAAMQNALRLAVVVAALVLAGAAVTSFVLVRQVTKPVDRLTTAAQAVEAATFDPDSLAEVAGRSDELGRLGRVFQRMAREVRAREQSLKQQVQELRIEIDEAKKAREVAAITETEYFQELRGKVSRLRNRLQPGQA